MMIEVHVQRATRVRPLPPAAHFRAWVTAALGDRSEAELTVRIVGSREMRRLNREYRGKDQPTNVLSFRAELPAEIPLPLLGDVVLCAPRVADEATAQGKPAEAHWAHLTVHGVLHLLGYDHEHAADAEVMERREVAVLAALGIANPYE